MTEGFVEFFTGDAGLYGGDEVVCADVEYFVHAAYINANAALYCQEVAF